MSVQFMKPAGPRFATSQTDTPLKKIDKIPWYIYFLGAAIYTAFAAAQRDVAETRNDPVPLHLRNAPTGLMKGLGYGQGYRYAHDFDDKVADMQCLPDGLRDRVYYHPTGEGVEKSIRQRIEEIKRKRSRAIMHSEKNKRES